MFGFGKKKKIIEMTFALINGAMGTYMIMRALSRHRMEKTGLGDLPLMLFEGSHILGIVDLLAHVHDPDEKYISANDILKTAESVCMSYEIFPEKDIEGVFQGVSTMLSEGNPVHGLMYTGAKDAQKFMNAILKKEDSSAMSRAMSLKYLDDDELIQEFKEFLRESGIDPNK
jgi:hypothetical protein